ncbi:MAG: hypothetical protein JSS63_06930 [Bacteroidetes bacterium]|nr:hypothetical protein [Bacteroidota bacterium]
MKQSNRISSEAKMDSLIQKILYNDFVYCPLDDLPVYIETGDLVKPDKIYKRYDSVKISSIDSGFIKGKCIDWLIIKIAKVNSDTTDIHLEVNYIASLKDVFEMKPSQKGGTKFEEDSTRYKRLNTKFSQINFLFNKISQKWELKGSTTDFVQ